MTDDEYKKHIDAYRMPNGVINWYAVLGIPRAATAKDIEIAYTILSAQGHPDDIGATREEKVRYVLSQHAMKFIGTPEARTKFDAFLLFEGQHAKLQGAMAAMEQFKKQENFIAETLEKVAATKTVKRANTPTKRAALLISVFPGAFSVWLLIRDLDRYSWEPSAAFLIFTMLTAALLIFALTGIREWVLSGPPTSADKRPTGRHHEN